MQCRVLMDTAQNRVEIYADGQWDLAVAEDFHREMVRVRNWTDRHPSVSVSILADLDGLILHTAPVSARVAQTVEQMRHIRIARYALVIPSYLMRMQCRRLLDGIPHRILESRAEAEAWLERQPHRGLTCQGGSRLQI